MKLIFATNNNNKVLEIQPLLPPTIELLTLNQVNIFTDIPEPYDTLEENARIKSQTIYELTGHNCFSEDSGLFVDALKGMPGVKSARYAGEGSTAEENIDKLLYEMRDQTVRTAQFKTIISLIINGREMQFAGICPGSLTFARRGGSGFGYDPIFVPDGDKRTFGEINISEKKKFSHRAKAIHNLLNTLNNIC